MRRITPFVLLLSTACSAEPELSVSTDEIANPTANQFPPSVGTFELEAFPAFGQFNPYAPPELLHCHAVLVSEYYALTSAHCFEDASVDEPYTIQLTFGGSTRLGTDVFFHPGAWTDGEQEWKTDRHPNDLVDAFDIALVRLGHPITGEPIAKLWHPNPWQTQPIAGKTLTIGGHHNGSWGTPATGTQTITGLVASGTGWLLEATNGPSAAQSGDSGGGAFLTITPDLASSFGGGCTPQLANQGDSALVGISQSCVNSGSTICGASLDLYVPVYTPDVFWWISKYVGDLDTDGICDGVDNCPEVQNPDQLNCNRLAEITASFEGNGIELGDACDPTPCADIDPVVQSFVASGVTAPFYQGGYIGTKSFGREIADRIDLVPAKNTEHAGTTTTYETRFCFCRDGNGEPIDDPTICAGAPFFCTLDPLQIYSGVVEIGSGLPPQPGETYWHQITVDFGQLGTQTGVGIQVPYDNGTKSFIWDYAADYQTWTQAGWMPVAPPNTTYGNGTDLAGAFWTKSGSDRGNVEHGLTEPDACGLSLANPTGVPFENCSMSHDFDFDIAPDRRSEEISAQPIPQYKPAPWWTYCPVCGDLLDLFGGRVTNPAPILTLDSSLSATLWTERGGVPVTGLLTPALQNAIGNARFEMLAPSEPMSIGLDRTMPRGLFLGDDGTTIAGALLRDASGFDFGSVPGGLDRRAAPATGFAAAFSRANGMVVVAGGVLARGGPNSTVRTFVFGRGWTSVALDRAGTPTNALAATYSMADNRLWVVDETATRSGTARRLLRIDPETGGVEIHSLSALAATGDVFLTTAEDGTVLLSQSSARSGHQLDLLASTAFRAGGSVTVVGSYLGSGPLTVAPVVDRGAVTIAVDVSSRTSTEVVPVRVPLSSF